MNPQLSDAENIKLIMRYTGVTESEARFILSIEKGEIQGDLQVVDDAGNELPLPPSS